ncbi:mannose-1-phosphate guanylyltransferase/mannose-6-phosphate isomerase [Thalassorhabdomicrobium marinisediminis]|uniref:mannose-1-phosphate guanylyltransferase n=1 Tax=Thalassorhabdomicrobium marinisediminis TaxID=2170577 RepID=A0A2T7FT96_9RHOB|nr:mannose-1-phosphate guanylyltransferase/mannose-6-phosphate isomerase [Thalassorhabdomicrobium marinisediminis]PVA05386.1 mannose-1-phosphate guanylyltransferase/mannose-6-phosphate isomerase [Thalassorhabdomicrobium marinisediminis]
MSISPVILCGGSGTRLWPLSRQSYPKQFNQLIGETSLFQQAALRLSDGENLFAPPMVLTGSDFRFIVSEQLDAIGIPPQDILIEPDARNTAPAVLAAALHLSASEPDAVMLVAPADHLIPDTAAFVASLKAGLKAVEAGQLVTFGIRPDRPETGFGYLQTATQPGADGAAVPLARFVEKPDLATAQEMIASGDYLWNSGIFLFRARDIIAAYETHAPELYSAVQAAVSDAHRDLSFVRLAPEAWSRIEDVSIDYAVMEKADNLSVVPFMAEWSDLGGWDAIWRHGAPDAAGVVENGQTTSIDCEDTLLRSDSPQVELVGIGLKNIVAVAMNDAVLVADKDRVQDVKIAVDRLKSKKASQATHLPIDHRPWGWFECLAISDRFQVKRIHVNPGAALSLQSHVHRSEHWIVVSGTARVTVDDEVKLVCENESVYIPLGAVHRMENPGKVPMVLIEVQTGAYLGEDDIIRYEDVYARGEGAKG